jgi:YidC/Oxa1 family membrane protein insertase
MTDAFVVANILQPLIDVFKELLTGLHGIVDSWGFAIICLTLVIRTLLLPLAVLQYRSMKGMAALGPKIKELQAKYPDDQQRVLTEQRKLMSEAGVNPLAGCFPILLQTPVFISLFYMLRVDLKHEICGINLQLPAKEIAKMTCESIKHHSGHFLFIDDITAKATGGILVLLLFLYCGSQLMSTLLMPSTVQGMQRNIFYALPFIFVPFIINFPAGLLLYWITTNLYTVFQQVTLRRIFGAPGADTGVSLGDGPADIVEGVVLEAQEIRASVGPSERPTKRKRTGKRR